jgi:hypothetical protein
MSDAQPELDMKSTQEDPGVCPECDAPWELVRPGKSQPTCTCQDKCYDCGMMRSHFSPGEVAERMSGFLCPNCDSDENKREKLIADGVLPADAKRPERPWLETLEFPDP